MIHKRNCPEVTILNKLQQWLTYDCLSIYHFASSSVRRTCLETPIGYAWRTRTAEVQNHRNEGRGTLFTRFVEFDVLGNVTSSLQKLMSSSQRICSESSIIPQEVEAEKCFLTRTLETNSCRLPNRATGENKSWSAWLLRLAVLALKCLWCVSWYEECNATDSRGQNWTIFLDFQEILWEAHEIRPQISVAIQLGPNTASTQSNFASLCWKGEAREMNCREKIWNSNKNYYVLDLEPRFWSWNWNSRTSCTAARCRRENHSEEWNDSSSKHSRTAQGTNTSSHHSTAKHLAGWVFRGCCHLSLLELDWIEAAARSDRQSSIAFQVSEDSIL